MNEELRKRREENKRRTKAELKKRIDDIKSNSNVFIVKKGVTKRRMNISISESVVREIETLTNNKSDLIEKLLIEYIKKENGKKIEVVRKLSSYIPKEKLSI